MPIPILKLEDYLFYYKAYVLDVTDGDTIKVDWDLGRRTAAPKEIIRFSRIDAIELNADGGITAKWFVRERILNQTVILKTELDRDSLTKYGGFNRFLAEVFYKTPEGWINLNDELLEAGLAGYYK